VPETALLFNWRSARAEDTTVQSYNCGFRDAFSDHGLIEWTDCRHYPGVGYQGVACKWYIKDLDDVEVGEEKVITVKGNRLRPVQVTPYEYHTEPPLLFAPILSGQEWWEWADERLEMTFSG